MFQSRWSSSSNPPRRELGTTLLLDCIPTRDRLSTANSIMSRAAPSSRFISTSDRFLISFVQPSRRFRNLFPCAPPSPGAGMMISVNSCSMFTGTHLIVESSMNWMLGVGRCVLRHASSPLWSLLSDWLCLRERDVGCFLCFFTSSRRCPGCQIDLGRTTMIDASGARDSFTSRSATGFVACLGS